MRSLGGGEVRRLAWFFLAPILALMTAGCRQDMQDQPRFKPLQRSNFFADGRSARPILAGTIARGQLPSDRALRTGESNGRLLDTLPVPLTRALLERGQERYDIYCSPCHSKVGDGRGIVELHGFRYPASFHTDRLRGAPAGYLYQVISNGFGAMPDYAYQVEPGDRWAIVAYIRVLQLSQHATTQDLDQQGREKLGLSGAAQ